MDAIARSDEPATVLLLDRAHHERLWRTRAPPQSGPGSGDRQLGAHIFRELDRNQHHRLAGKHAAGRPCHGATAPRRRISPRQTLRVLIGPDAKHGNLVARYRGSGAGGARPIIVFAHLDVVPAGGRTGPSIRFTFLEKDGYFYGRGTTDNKAGAAMLVADFISAQAGGVQAAARPRPDTRGRPKRPRAAASRGWGAAPGT